VASISNYTAPDGDSHELTDPLYVDPAAGNFRPKEILVKNGGLLPLYSTEDVYGDPWPSAPGPWPIGAANAPLLGNYMNRVRTAGNIYLTWISAGAPDPAMSQYPGGAVPHDDYVILGSGLGILPTYTINRARHIASGLYVSWLSTGGANPTMSQYPGSPDPADYTDFVAIPGGSLAQ